LTQPVHPFEYEVGIHDGETYPHNDELDIGVPFSTIGEQE